jgi:hypothetical protein
LDEIQTTTAAVGGHVQHTHATAKKKTLHQNKRRTKRK